jgi:hypothetical protein
MNNIKERVGLIPARFYLTDFGVTGIFPEFRFLNQPE